MEFFRRLANALSFREGAPTQYPAVPPEQMAQTLRAMTDVQWGRYAFSREPLEGKFTPEQKDAYTLAAVQCGREWADRMARQYGSREPDALARTMGIRVHTAATPAGGGQVLFAQFVQPDEITIFTDCLDKAEALGGILPERELLRGILLAHELFHAVEEQNEDIYTRTEKIELWRKPFSNRSCIVCLSEIAAMAFAKQLLGLSFNPYALDVLLVFAYDPNAAYGLYDEICELTKDV